MFQFSTQYHDEKINMSWLELISKDYQYFDSICTEIFNKNPDQTCRYHSDIDVDEFEIQSELNSVQQIEFCVDPISKKQDQYGTSAKLNNTILGRYYFDIQSDFCQKINQILDLKYNGAQIGVQLPGNITPTHYDRDRTFYKKKLPVEITNTLRIEQIKKYVIFLEDQKIGQVFVTGNHALQWKKGTVIEIPWYMPHATANCSTEKRSLILVPGIVNT